MNTDVGEVFLYYVDHSIFTVEITDTAIELDFDNDYQETKVVVIRIKAVIKFEGSEESKKNWLENDKTMPVADLNAPEVFSVETDKFQEYLISHPEAFI